MSNSFEFLVPIPILLIEPEKNAFPFIQCTFFPTAVSKKCNCRNDTSNGIWIHNKRSSHFDKRHFNRNINFMLIVEKENRDMDVREWEERLLLYFGTNKQPNMVLLLSFWFVLSNVSCHETWIKIFTYKIWLHLHMFHIMPFFFSCSFLMKN